MPVSTYVIALGSNRPHGRHGPPRRVITVALAEIARAGIHVHARSPIFETVPVGPSSRRYANAAAIVETADSPPALLAKLKRLEHAFGRRRGQRWGARVIDLDIIFWSGGLWASHGLGIPHRHFRSRTFVLKPVAAIAPEWSDPLTNLTVRQCLHRLERRRPVDRCRQRS